MTLTTSIALKGIFGLKRAKYGIRDKKEKFK